MRELVIARATGKPFDEEAYATTRVDLRGHKEVWRALPSFVRNATNGEQIWTYVQPLAPDYARRRQAINEAFEPAFNAAERSPEESEGSIRPEPVGRTVQADSRRRVFVVHGHNKGPRDAVARLLVDLLLEPVILEEQPDGGRTIIEKFEAYADVHFAVVVMTPEDVGGLDSESLAKRARQNVVLELGFFIGRLGRANVSALVVGVLERPSDVAGVLYTPFDDLGAWRIKLANDMAAAGLSIDKNRIK